MSAPRRLARGESPSPVEPAAISKHVYRGAMWELIAIGRLWPAVAQLVLLVLLLGFAVAGQPWPSIICSAALIAVAIWCQRNVVSWAEAHNARVAPSRAPKSKASPPPARSGRRQRRR